MSIFRREALEYQCVRLSGTVSLSLNRRTSYYGVCFLLASGLAVVAFQYAEFAVTTPVKCQVRADSTAEIAWPAGAFSYGKRVEAVELHTSAGRRFINVQRADLGKPISMPVAIAANGGGACEATVHQRMNLAKLIVARFLRLK